MIFDTTREAYKHPRHVDALPNNIHAIRRLLKDIGMPEFAPHTTVRAMKLRYRLAHAGVLEQCERVHGPSGIDQQAERHKGRTMEELIWFCRSHGQSTQGNQVDLLWRVNRYDLGIEKLDNKGYRIIDGAREGSVSSPPPQQLKSDIQQERKAELDLDGYEEMEQPGPASQRRRRAAPYDTLDEEPTFDPSVSAQDYPQHPPKVPAVAQTQSAPTIRGSTPEPEARSKSSSSRRVTQPMPILVTSTTVGDEQQHTAPDATVQVQHTKDCQPERTIAFEPDGVVREFITRLGAWIWRMTIFPVWETMTRDNIIWDNVIFPLWAIMTHRNIIWAAKFLWRHRRPIVAILGLIFPALKVLTKHWPWLEKVYHTMEIVLDWGWRCVSWFTKHPGVWTFLTSWWPALHQFGFDWWKELGDMVCATLGCPECRRQWCDLRSKNGHGWCELKSGVQPIASVLETVAAFDTASLAEAIAASTCTHTTAAAWNSAAALVLQHCST